MPDGNKKTDAGAMTHAPKCENQARNEDERMQDMVSGSNLAETAQWICYGVSWWLSSNRLDGKQKTTLPQRYVPKTLEAAVRATRCLWAVNFKMPGRVEQLFLLLLNAIALFCPMHV